MNFCRTLIAAIIFIGACLVLPAQNPADSCAALLLRLEELGKKQNLAGMVLLAMKAETVCQKEFGAKSLQYAEAVSMRGFAYVGTGRYKEALALFLKERELRLAAQSPRDDDAYGILQSNLTQAYMHLGKFDSAGIHNDSALVIALKVSGPESGAYANRLVNKGIVFYRRGDTQIDSAEFYSRKGLQILRNSGDSSFFFMTNALNTLGMVLKDQGRYEESISLFDEAWRRARTEYGETHFTAAILLGNKSVAVFENGQYFNAEAPMEQVVRDFERVNFTAHPIYWKMLTNLSSVKSMLGKYEEALSLQEKAGRIPHGVGAVDSAEFYAVMATVHIHTGREGKAVDLLRKSIKMFEKAEKKNDLHYLQALSNLEVVYNELGNYEEAAVLMDRTAEIARKLWQHPNQQYAIHLHNIANNYFDLGEYEKAEKFLAEALEMARGAKSANPVLAQIYATSAYFGQKAGQYKTARKLSKKSRRIYEKNPEPENIGYCKLLVSTAVLQHKTGHPQKAAKLFSRAKSLLEKSGNVNTEAYYNCLLAFAKFQMNRHKYGEAFALLEYAHQKLLDRIDANFTFLSENGKERFLQKNEDNLQIFPRFAAQNPLRIKQSAGLAYDNELAVKGLLLNSVHAVAASIYASGDSTLIQQFQTWKTNRQLLARQWSLPAEERLVQKRLLDSLQRVTEDAEVDLTIRSAAFRDARSRVSWQQVRDSLSAGEAAIEFTHFRDPGRSDSVYYAAIVLVPGATDPVFVRLFEESRLAAHLNDAVEGAADYKEYVGMAYRGREQTALYRLVWQPLEPLLGQTKTVWYAPTGLLHRVAFAAITPEAGRPLVKNYDLRLVGSTREVVFRRPLGGNAVKTALLIGGIEYAADSTCLVREGQIIQQVPLLPEDIAGHRGGCAPGPVPALPGTRKETDTLASLLQSQMQVRLLQGCTAREESVKRLGDPGKSKSLAPDLMHIATHGFFCEDNRASKTLPLTRCGLLMAGAQRIRMGEKPFAGMEDGILYASEIAEIDLTGTKLVALSACETALGDIRGGEGVYGLARAFRLAGVEHVIMSLWQIHDTETVLFMETLYRHWQGDTDIRAAFLATQRELQAAGKGEETWAAFVLI